MGAREIYGELARWTPFLGVGFAWNIAISVAAMALGTVGGAVLAIMREHHRRALARPGLALTEFARNVPTFVFLFYVAYLLPPELHFAGLAIPCPGWVKASIALSIAVVGYVSDNLSIVLHDWRAGRHDTALLFLPSWTAYLLIIVMASSTASVIGVSEIVARCNIVVAATGNNALLAWIYLYAMLWFFVFCYPLMLVMDRVKTRLARRIRAQAAVGSARCGSSR
jgi:polar amino acid transport system permease protein